jgi:hypothetical protein
MHNSYGLVHALVCNDERLMGKAKTEAGAYVMLARPGHASLSPVLNT